MNGSRLSEQDKLPNWWQEFIPSTTRVLGPSATPKSRNWWERRHQPSGYQPSKRRSVAGGAPHPALPAWEGEIFTLTHLLGSKTLGTSGQWGGAIPWDWPESSSSVQYSWELLQEYLAVPSKICTGILHLVERDNLLSLSMVEVMEEEMLTPQALWKRPDPQMKYQSPRENEQLPYMLPTAWKRLHCLRKLAV